MASVSSLNKPHSACFFSCCYKTAIDICQQKQNRIWVGSLQESLLGSLKERRVTKSHLFLFFPMDATEVCQFQLWKSKQMVAWKWWNHVMTSHPSSFGNRAGSFWVASKMWKDDFGMVTSELGSTKKTRVVTGVLEGTYNREMHSWRWSRRPSMYPITTTRALNLVCTPFWIDPPVPGTWSSTLRPWNFMVWSTVWRASTTLPRRGRAKKMPLFPPIKGEQVQKKDRHDFGAISQNHGSVEKCPKWRCTHYPLPYGRFRVLEVWSPAQVGMLELIRERCILDVWSPPKNLRWQWNMVHQEWRCISCWKWGIFQCHVSFQGWTTEFFHQQQ